MIAVMDITHTRSNGCIKDSLGCVCINRKSRLAHGESGSGEVFHRMFGEGVLTHRGYELRI
jgi:hypothetical protein